MQENSGKSTKELNKKLIDNSKKEGIEITVINDEVLKKQANISIELENFKRVSKNKLLVKEKKLHNQNFRISKRTVQKKQEQFKKIESTIYKINILSIFKIILNIIIKFNVNLFNILKNEITEKLENIKEKLTEKQERKKILVNLVIIVPVIFLAVLNIYTFKQVIYYKKSIDNLIETKRETENMETEIEVLETENKELNKKINSKK